MQKSQEKVIINGLEVRYLAMGLSVSSAERLAGRFTILILHGWGRGLEAWRTVAELLSQNGHEVVAPDLPGFGQSSQLPFAWGVEEYSAFVASFAEKLGLTKFVLLGHSFGGQIAVQYVANHVEQVEKLILVAPATIRKPQEKTNSFFGTIGKIVNVLPFSSFVKRVGYKVLGRHDYQRAQGVMREVMKKIITQDVSHLFSSLIMPVLLVWGDKDEKVPVEYGYQMKKQIPSASLEILPGVKHAPNAECPEKLAVAITKFLELQSRVLPVSR